MSTSVDPYGRTQRLNGGASCAPDSDPPSSPWASLEHRLTRVEGGMVRLLEVSVETRAMVRAGVIGFALVIAIGILIALAR